MYIVPPLPHKPLRGSSHESLRKVLLPWSRFDFACHNEDDSTEFFFLFFFFEQIGSLSRNETRIHENRGKISFFFFLKKNEIVNTRDLFTALENLEHLFDSISFLFDTRFFLFEILWIISIEEKRNHRNLNKLVQCVYIYIYILSES